MIKFESARPEREFGGYGRISYGRYNTIQLEGAVTGPVSDTVSARLSVLHQRRSDYVDNTENGPGDDLEGYEESAARLQFLFEFDPVAALHPEKVILFGSYAYGTPSDHSDVDLLVILETDARPADRYLAVSRLIRPRPFPLDILVKTPDEITQALAKGDGFIREIVTQGRVLYARSD